MCCRRWGLHFLVALLQIKSSSQGVLQSNSLGPTSLDILSTPAPLPPSPGPRELFIAPVRLRRSQPPQRSNDIVLPPAFNLGRAFMLAMEMGAVE